MVGVLSNVHISNHSSLRSPLPPGTGHSHLSSGLLEEPHFQSASLASVLAP